MSRSVSSYCSFESCASRLDICGGVNWYLSVANHIGYKNKIYICLLSKKPKSESVKFESKCEIKISNFL